MDNLRLKVENIVAKGEIACFSSNFFFCHYVFRKLFAAEASESFYMRERVNTLTKSLTAPRQNKKQRCVG